MLHRRRIDPHLDPLAQQIADEPVERLVGAVPHIIVIAREKGHAEVAGLHGGGAVGVYSWASNSDCRRLPGAMRGCSCLAVCRATLRSPRGVIMRIRPTSSGGCSAAQSARSCRRSTMKIGSSGLPKRRIGLWDVIASATRRGSLDQAIREAEHNRIEHLLHDFPDLRAIAFNGATAASVGRKLIGDAPPPGVDAASTCHPRVRRTRGRSREKAAAWALLDEFVEPRSLSLARSVVARHDPRDDADRRDRRS